MIRLPGVVGRSRVVRLPGVVRLGERRGVEGEQGCDEGREDYVHRISFRMRVGVCRQTRLNIEFNYSTVVLKCQAWEKQLEILAFFVYNRRVRFGKKISAHSSVGRATPS